MLTCRDVMLFLFMNVQDGSNTNKAHKHSFVLCLVPFCSAISSPPCRFMAVLDLILGIFCPWQLMTPLRRCSVRQPQTRVYHRHAPSFTQPIQIKRPPWARPWAPLGDAENKADRSLPSQSLRPRYQHLPSISSDCGLKRSLFV